MGWPHGRDLRKHYWNLGLQVSGKWIFLGYFLKETLIHPNIGILLQFCPKKLVHFVQGSLLVGFFRNILEGWGTIRKQSWGHEYFRKALITPKKDVLTKFWPKKLVSFVFKISFMNFSKISSADIYFKAVWINQRNNSKYVRKNSYLTRNETSYLNVDPKVFFVKFLECRLKHCRHCSTNHL